MNQSHFLDVGKLMANHRAGVKPRIPVADHILRFTGRSNSSATSIGVLPLLNKHKACVDFDLLPRLISSLLLARPSILRMMAPMSLKLM